MKKVLAALLMVASATAMANDAAIQLKLNYRL